MEAVCEWEAMPQKEEDGQIVSLDDSRLDYFQVVELLPRLVYSHSRAVICVAAGHIHDVYIHASTRD